MKHHYRLAIGVLLCLAGPAWAGPNIGGTLIVHDTGLVYSVDSDFYPSTPPAIDPPGVDNNLPVEFTPAGWVWKVYAAFPAGTAPRLKALVMGEQFGGDVFVLAGGLPSPNEFEIAQNGWPTSSGGGVGLSFGATQTAQVVECYWFGGYGYLGGIWAVAPHPTQEMLFVDDAVPPNEDAIAGLSTIGFGVNGQTVYPIPPPPVGACCFPDGHCEAVPEADCSAIWYGVGTTCDPNPCPPPSSGACCDVDGNCWFVPEAECPTGDWRSEVSCTPNPCPPPPTGACCHPDGHCVSVVQSNCSTGDWRLDTPCDPNPCPQLAPSGACCDVDGNCWFVPEAECPTGDWRSEVSCTPNPCPPPPTGACCHPDGHCVFVVQSNCSTGDWHLDTPCDPNPCPQPGGGPNAAGVLVVHDTGQTYTSGIDQYPSDPPASCNEVDNIAAPDSLTVWKVYAAFPEENSPRLKALAFGEEFNPGLVTVLAGGLPSDLDFEIPQNGWPSAPGGGVGISFGQTQTGHMVEVYWFGGYGAHTGEWRTAPHPVQETVFVDDAQPPHADAIAGLGSIGFGIVGETPCGSQNPNGACCFASGACTMLFESVCVAAGGDFYGGECLPSPCPQPPPVGACCFPDGRCEVLDEVQCTGWGGTFVGGGCDPNPCPQPPVGACCYPDGQCELQTQFGCPTGDWREGVSCEPNPCPVLPSGACCYWSGGCVYTQQGNCPTGDWREGIPCEPNPCSPPPPTGACCVGANCSITTQDQCNGSWLGAGSGCSPNPCCAKSVGRPAPSPAEGYPATIVGPGHGVISGGDRPNPCPGSTLYANDDGSIENAFTWQLMGVVPPDYGAFAEGYYGIEGVVCGVGLLLTRWGTMTGDGGIDIYVWDYSTSSDNPGSVLSMTGNAEICGVDLWPTISTIEIDCADAYCGPQGFFVGYWPRTFVGVMAEFGCAMDQDGFGGAPRTNIAPGIGYPTGWQHPSVAGYSLQAFGLRGYIGGMPTPTIITSWGRIKELYR